MEEPITNGDKRNPDGTFALGNPGGPGRPVGSISIKDKVRQYLEEHPESVDEIVTHFVKNNRELMWQMLEGKPSQGIGQAPDLDKLPPLLVKFLKDEPDNGDTGGVQEAL